MKLFSSLVLVLGIFMMSACASKGTSYSKKHKATPERSVAAKKAKPTDASSCQLGQDQRNIAIERTSVGGCQVHYEKSGSSSTIAEARNDLSYCGQVREKVVRNLEQAGFQCQGQMADSGEAKTSN